MLSRGLFDTLSLWPAVFWPIVFSSCFYGFLRLCQIGMTSGYSPLGGARLSDKMVAFGVLPAGFLIEAAIHIYLLYVIGYTYIVAAIPIYIFGWVLIPWILDGFRPGLAVLGVTHATFAAAFMVYLGFFEVDLMRDLNSNIYGLLMGVPANL